MQTRSATRRFAATNHDQTPDLQMQYTTDEQESVHTDTTGSQAMSFDNHPLIVHPNVSQFSFVHEGSRDNHPYPPSQKTPLEVSFDSLFDGPLTPLPSHMELSSDEGMHTVFQNQDGQTFTPELTIDDSFNSLFDSPLDSSDSIEHLEGSESSTSARRSQKNIPSLRPHPSLFDALYHVREFGTPQYSTHIDQDGAVVGPTSPLARSLSRSRRSQEKPTLPIPRVHACPQELKHSRHRHWKMGTSGSLIPVVDEDDSDDSTSAYLPLKEDEIFSREMKKLRKRKKALMREIAASEDNVTQRFNKTMRDQAMAVFFEQMGENKTRGLGPEGTELIDEGEGFDYPAEWVERQSQGLQAYPTQPAI